MAEEVSPYSTSPQLISPSMKGGRNPDVGSELTDGIALTEGMELGSDERVEGIKLGEVETVRVGMDVVLGETEGIELGPTVGVIDGSKVLTFATVKY